MLLRNFSAEGLPMMVLKQLLVVLAHGFVGWALCAATMFVGMITTTMENTLILHAIRAPLFFALLSLIYVRYFNYTSPLRTAMLFLMLVVTVDFFLVALLINKSLEMFTSLLGTWLPFALIFASTYLTMAIAGRVMKRKGRV